MSHALALVSAGVTPAIGFQQPAGMSISARSRMHTVQDTSCSGMAALWVSSAVRRSVLDHVCSLQTSCLFLAVASGKRSGLCFLPAAFPRYLKRPWARASCRTRLVGASSPGSFFHFGTWPQATSFYRLKVQINLPRLARSSCFCVGETMFCSRSLLASELGEMSKVLVKYQEV